ncbi:MAG: terminase TerL endonuclease subunit [Dehalococcoidia bacterium]
MIPSQTSTDVERALAFLGQLVLPSGRTLGSSFETDPWLVDSVLAPALARDGEARPLHRRLWWEDVKGAGKTSLLGALGFTECALEPGLQCYIVAGDAEQAGLVLEALSGLLAHSPSLRRAVRQTSARFTLSNGSFLKVMSADSETFHGVGTGRRQLYLLDELTNWPDTPRHESLYHAVMSSLAKTPSAAIRIAANPGVAGSWQAEAKEKLAAAGACMYDAPPGRLPSWVSREDVEALRLVLPEPLWARYYGGRWVSEVTGQAISTEAWDACHAELPPLDARTPLVVGIDAGVTHDCFAIVVVAKYLPPRGEPAYVHSELISLQLPPRASEAEVWVRAVGVWEPQGVPLDFGEPRRWLAEFVREHRVVCIAYDPYQLHSWATDFGRDHGVWMAEFSQQGARAQADADLVALVRAGRLRHDGDEVLRSHALGAAFRVSTDGRARFVKAHGSKKIDALVALSMASAQGMYLNLPIIRERAGLDQV